jgi:hypothetical protein
MKKIIISLFLALMATTGLNAQQISVVSSGGSTSLYRTLQDAIEGADPGSVIYLPGGGFTIADSVKITKKLTIIGIGHYSKSDNVDGVTTISGNLWFNEGSSGSAVMGCYITGNVNIGDGGAAVSDVLIKYCNLNSVQVKNNTCLDVAVNQNYIRSMSSFNGANAKISNNVIHSIYKVNGGRILNNIIRDKGNPGINDLKYFSIWADYSIISYNVMFIGQGSGSNWSNASIRGSNNSGTDNIVGYYTFGENCISWSGKSWNDLFENPSGITPSSNYHFKEAYSEYENLIGLYAGNGFNDQQIAPVPYIVAKRVDEQTDASGKLNVKIRVKAGE